MAQLVQLQEEIGELLEEHDAQVVVVFREESEGQTGLERVVQSTNTEFILALDTPADKTAVYSPGDQVHDSYVIDSSGTIQAILKGKRYDRAQASEFADALGAL